MARDWFDTGNHGIALGLEYGSIVDAATGGAVTADTTSVKISNLEAWIKTDDWPFTDSSNKLSCAGALVVDDSWSNISAGTSSSKKLKELSPASKAIVFGSTSTGTVSLTLTGIEAAGETLSGSRKFTLPKRPYHAPAMPTLTLSAGYCAIAGAQTDPEKDSFWEAVNTEIESNDVWGGASIDLPGNTAGLEVPSASNSRYRVRVTAKNVNATGATATTGYWYTTPNTPNAVVATRAAGSTQVNLSWGANGSRYAGSYRIYRSLNGGAFSQLKDVTTTSTTDTVPLGSTANYYVVALSLTGVNQAVSANSAQVAVGAGYNVPNAPVVSLVRTGATTATIMISGNQNTATNDRYTAQLDWQIQVNGGAFGGGATNLAGSTTSIPVTGLPADSQIKVQARFGNASGESGWAQSGYLYTTPDAPTAFNAARADAASSTVNLSWVDNASYGNSYLLEKQVGTGAWTQVATFSGAATSGSVQQSQAEAANYRMRVVTADNQYSGYSATDTVGVAFVTNKAGLKIGANNLGYCYVGTQRIRRIVKGSTVIWEDGDA